MFCLRKDCLSIGHFFCFFQILMFSTFSRACKTYPTLPFVNVAILNRYWVITREVTPWCFTSPIRNNQEHETASACYLDRVHLNEDTEAREVKTVEAETHDQISNFCLVSVMSHLGRKLGSKLKIISCVIFSKSNLFSEVPSWVNLTGNLAIYFSE